MRVLIQSHDKLIYILLYLLIGVLLLEYTLSVHTYKYVRSFNIRHEHVGGRRWMNCRMKRYFRIQFLIWVGGFCLGGSIVTHLWRGYWLFRRRFFHYFWHCDYQLWLMFLGLLRNYHRLIPGVNKYNAIPCVSGTLVVVPGIFKIDCWRQVTVYFEARYYSHWVY